MVVNVTTFVEACTENVFSGAVAKIHKYLEIGVAGGVNVLFSDDRVSVVGLSPIASADKAVEDVEPSLTVDVSKGKIVCIMTTVIGDAVTVLADSVSVTLIGVSVSVTVRPGCVIVTIVVLVAWIVMVDSDSPGADDVVVAAGEETSASIGVTDSAVSFADSLRGAVEALAISVEYAVV